MTRRRMMTEAQIDELVQVYRAWQPMDKSDGRSMKDIAMQFGVSVATISRELRHRQEPLKDRTRPVHVEVTRPALTDSQVERLLDMVVELANELGASRERVRVLEERALATPILTPGTEALIDALLRADERIRLLERQLGEGNML